MKYSIYVGKEAINSKYHIMHNHFIYGTAQFKLEEYSRVK